MIKKGNNIRFGNTIFIVENINGEDFLLKNKTTNVLNWVKKSDILENIKKINFSYNMITESKLEKSKLSYKDDYITIIIEEKNNESEINIITESEIYSKSYPYSKNRTIYEFEKHFKYVNELTPYKLCKVGFSKHSNIRN